MGGSPYFSLEDADRHVLWPETSRKHRRSDYMRYQELKDKDYPQDDGPEDDGPWENIPGPTLWDGIVGFLLVGVVLALVVVIVHRVIVYPELTLITVMNVSAVLVTAAVVIGVIGATVHLLEGFPPSCYGCEYLDEQPNSVDKVLRYGIGVFLCVLALGFLWGVVRYMGGV